MDLSLVYKEDVIADFTRLHYGFPFVIDLDMQASNNLCDEETFMFHIIIALFFYLVEKELKAPDYTGLRYLDKFLF